MQNTFWEDFNILTNADGSKLAYNKLEGGTPGIIFLHGLNSDRRGTKAEHLLDYCLKKEKQFISFDMFGHGSSSGQMKNATLSTWINNTLSIIDNVSKGPQFIIGSSMGGWVMVKTAEQRKKVICGMIGIAAAPDFTENLIWNKMTNIEKEQLVKKGFIAQDSDYDNSPYIISKKLIEDGKKNLILENIINLDIPCILIHGKKDRDVPWQTSLKLALSIQSRNIKNIIIEDGSHRLSTNSNLDVLTSSLGELYEAYQNNNGAIEMNL